MSSSQNAGERPESLSCQMRARSEPLDNTPRERLVAAEANFAHRAKLSEAKLSGRSHSTSTYSEGRARKRQSYRAAQPILR